MVCMATRPVNRPPGPSFTRFDTCRVLESTYTKPSMRGMDFHRAAALGERPERADRDRTTQKHHAEERSRTRRRIQAMTPVPRREDHRVCLSGYSKSLAAPPASPRRLRAVILGHDGSRSCTSRGVKPALPHACGGYVESLTQPARRQVICLGLSTRSAERRNHEESLRTFASNCTKVQSPECNRHLLFRLII